MVKKYECKYGYFAKHDVSAMLWRVPEVWNLVWGASVGKIVTQYVVFKHFCLFQNISYYGLLSKDPILNPKPIDRRITLPFYPGCRYAAVPGSSNHNDAVQVNMYSARPEHLVYHDHSFHIGDLKVACLILTSLIKLKCCIGFPRYKVCPLR